MSAGNKMDGEMSGKVMEADRDKTVTEPNMDRSDISLPQRPSQSLLTTKRPAVISDSSSKDSLCVKVQR